MKFLLICAFINAALSSDITENSNQSFDLHDDYYDESNDCTVDTLIDHIGHYLLPDDYEEGNKLNKSSIKFSVDHINQTIQIFRRLEQYSTNVSEKLNPIIKRIGSRLAELVALIDLPSDCLASLARIASAAQSGHKWALSFIDSQISLASGVLEGEFPTAIEYDQCLDIKSEHQLDKQIIVGQYCSLYPNVPLPDQYDSQSATDPFIDQLFASMMASLSPQQSDEFNELMRSNAPQLRAYRDNSHNGSLKFQSFILDAFFGARGDFGGSNAFMGRGICLPSTCKAVDIEYALNKLIYPITRLPLHISPDCVYRDRVIQLDGYQRISIYCLTTLTLLVLVSTIIEVCLEMSASEPPFDHTSDGQTNGLTYGRAHGLVSSLRRVRPIIVSFSLVSNAKRLVSAKVVNDRFVCLDAIRVIFSLWIISVHVWSFNSSIISMSKSFWTTVPGNFGTSDKYLLQRNFSLTGLFFMIGGLFTCYVMLSKLERSGGRFDYMQYAIFRYAHVVPPMVGSMLFYYLLPLTGEGPLWEHYMYGLVISCKTNWHSSLLMVSNYNTKFPDKSVCGFVSWYTSTDFQMYLIAPLLFMPLYRRPKLGLMLSLGAIVLGLFTSVAPMLLFGVHYLYDYKSVANLREAELMVKHTLWGVEQFIGCYCSGVLLGYLIRRKPNANFGGPRVELLIWIASWSATIWSLLWSKDYLDPKYRLQRYQIYLSAAFQRHCFNLGWMWLIYACATGRAGWLNRALGWSYLKLFANISLEIYLVHLLPIFYRIASLKSHIMVTDYYLLSTYISDTMISCVLAVVLNLLVTAPFNQLIHALIPQQVKHIDKHS